MDVASLFLDTHDVNCSSLKTCIEVLICAMYVSLKITTLRVWSRIISDFKISRWSHDIEINFLWYFCFVISKRRNRAFYISNAVTGNNKEKQWWQFFMFMKRFFPYQPKLALEVPRDYARSVWPFKWRHQATLTESVKNASDRERSLEVYIVNFIVSTLSADALDHLKAK